MRNVSTVHSSVSLSCSSLLLTEASKCFSGQHFISFYNVSVLIVYHRNGITVGHFISFYNVVNKSDLPLRSASVAKANAEK